jgi:hypothetical protein
MIPAELEEASVKMSLRYRTDIRPARVPAVSHDITNVASDGKDSGCPRMPNIFAYQVPELGGCKPSHQPRSSEVGMRIGWRAALAVLVLALALQQPAFAGGHGATCTKTGGPEDDILRGTNGPDVLCGKGGHDVLIGRGGRDILRGGSGPDVLRPGSGPDRIVGGPGGDTLSYADGVLPVGVDLATGLATGQGHDVILGVENVVGTFSADTLLGDAEDNLFRGYRGDDTIRGRGGHDKLVGEGDDDGLFGGLGDDTLNGGPGTDRCRQGSGTGRRWNCER